MRIIGIDPGIQGALAILDNEKVIDIVDLHSTFKNQFKKRQTFYKKNKYKVIHTDSYTYESKKANDAEWETLVDVSKSGTKKPCKANNKANNNNVIDINETDMPGICLIDI